LESRAADIPDFPYEFTGLLPISQGDMDQFLRFTAEYPPSQSSRKDA
jgi:hypothetical protein